MTVFVAGRYAIVCRLSLPRFLTTRGSRTSTRAAIGFYIRRLSPSGDEFRGLFQYGRMIAAAPCMHRAYISQQTTFTI